MSRTLVSTRFSSSARACSGFTVGVEHVHTPLFSFSMSLLHRVHVGFKETCPKLNSKEHYEPDKAPAGCPFPTACHPFTGYRCDLWAHTKVVWFILLFGIFYYT